MLYFYIIHINIIICVNIFSLPLCLTPFTSSVSFLSACLALAAAYFAAVAFTFLSVCLWLINAEAVSAMRFTKTEAGYSNSTFLFLFLFFFCPIFFGTANVKDVLL